MNIFHKSARVYRDKFDLSVFPIGQNKKPLVPWKEFQKRKPELKEIDEWYRQFPEANIGIVCGKINDLCVVDIDYACGFDELSKYIPAGYPHPVSTTPRGGQHWWFSIGDHKLRNNVAVIPGTDLRAEGGYIIAPPSQMLNGSYSWVEGKKINQLNIPPIPDQYADAVVKLSTRCRQVSPVSSSVVTMFSEGRRDDDLFHVAYYLTKANMPESEIFQVITLLANSCGFPGDEAVSKVMSALERSNRKERNLTEEVREYVLSSNGVILSSDVVKCLQLSSREEIKHVSKVMSRLTDEKIIRRYGNRNGQFMVIDDKIELMNWRNAPTGEFDLNLPLGIDNFVKIQPKNLIIIAGATNAGKTALLLNIVISNIKNKDSKDLKPCKRIKYFTSEMSEQEMLGRISNFNIPLEQWDFDAYDRCGNFADVIDPEAINIIDFLELHDDFWKVGALLKEIFDKLTTGIAIVAIQKKKGQYFGRGGELSAEKARLYISLDEGVCQIRKGKNWRDPEVNPNGLTCEFKLVAGCKFMRQGQWYRDDGNGNKVPVYATVDDKEIQEICG